MPDTPPTEAEVDHIIAADKWISGDIERVPSRNRGWVEFILKVESDEGWPLTLVGKARLGPPYKRCFSLILRRVTSGYRIYALDVNGSHRNVGVARETWRYRTHKQRWLNDHGDGFAFTPEESIPEEKNAAFLEFCRECNIVFSGQMGQVPARGQ